MERSPKARFPRAMSADPGATVAPALGDRALLARMADGDERALGALYDRWAAVVYALVVRIVGDRDEAEDVVEDVFWQLWRQAPRYEETRGAVSTWVFTVARSRALDRRRAMRRRCEESASDATTDTAGASAASAAVPGAAGSDPAGNAEQAERREIVAAALHELPAEQREAVELAYFGGLSQTEIAERTGQPLGTVKTRTRLAMQKLRDRLAPLRDREEEARGGALQ